MMLPKLRMLQMESIVSICPRVRPIEAGPLEADLVLGPSILDVFSWLDGDSLEVMLSPGWVLGMFDCSMYLTEPEECGMHVCMRS